MTKQEQIKNMNKKEFLEFINKSFDIEGCLGGLMLSGKINGKDIEITLFLTNYELYQDFKKTEDFKTLQKHYSEEDLTEYEKELYQNHLNLINNTFDPLKFYDETLHEINEHLLNYYDAHEDELDQELIYNSKDYILEEMGEQGEEAQELWKN